MSKLPYRPCVGIMVLNSQDKVWVGRRGRNEEEVDDEPKLWQMPQGGIDRKEDPVQAAKRELEEETGIRSVSYLAEVEGWLRYDLPDEKVGIALKGKYCGQEQRWFAFRFEGDESEININLPNGDDPPEFDAWQWVNMEELPDLIVPFKREIYEVVVAEFRYLVK